MTLCAKEQTDELQEAVVQKATIEKQIVRIKAVKDTEFLEQSVINSGGKVSKEFEQ